MSAGVQNPSIRDALVDLLDRVRVMWISQTGVLDVHRVHYQDHLVLHGRPVVECLRRAEVGAGAAQCSFCWRITIAVNPDCFCRPCCHHGYDE